MKIFTKSDDMLFMSTILTLLFTSVFLPNMSKASAMPVLENLSNEFISVRDFTLHENEAYFSAQSILGDTSVIIRIKKKMGQWGEPKITTFSGKYHDLEPFLSTDGLTLLFASNRPKGKQDKTKDYDIWKVIRKNVNSSWSIPINMGDKINSDKNEFYPSLAKNRNLYFTANLDDSKGKDDIYFSEFKNEQYQVATSLSQAINTVGEEYNAFIAPDESYLIFGAYQRKDGFGSGDLYISYKNESNEWSKAINMGDKVNSKQMDYCPYVVSKSNLLYFTSRRSQKNTINKFQNIKELLNHLNQSENGLSRIYKTPIVEFVKNKLN